MFIAECYLTNIADKEILLQLLLLLLTLSGYNRLHFGFNVGEPNIYEQGNTTAAEKCEQPIM
jgi:hypothetical protein